MECNKDEAIRAKSIAEGKLQQKDIFGAKKFALKAQTLYPGLDGISQMLTTLDVYVSAENKIGGEIDWYGVLSVNPSADDETIKRQYRKMALMLHPDKNNSVGADGAFKLISEAWSLLSDKAKRSAYNQRRGYKEFQQKVPAYTGGPSGPFKPNQPKVPTHTGGKQKVPTHTGGPSAPSMRTKTTSSKSQNGSAKVPSKPAPANPAPSDLRTGTFWTVCRGCNMHYEYLKIYCNLTLLCSKCQKPFMASEIDPPAEFFRSTKTLAGRRGRRRSTCFSPSEGKRCRR